MAADSLQPLLYASQRPLILTQQSGKICNQLPLQQAVYECTAMLGQHEQDGNDEAEGTGAMLAKPHFLWPHCKATAAGTMP